MTVPPIPPDEPTRAQLFDAIKSLGESFHDLNLNVLSLHRRHDERQKTDDVFHQSLLHMLGTLDSRMQYMQTQLASQIDSARHDIDAIRTDVQSISDIERAHHRDLDSRIRLLETRTQHLEHRLHQELFHDRSIAYTRQLDLALDTARVVGQPTTEPERSEPEPAPG